MKKELAAANLKVDVLRGFLQDLIDRENHSDWTQDNTNVYWVHSKFGVTTVGTWAKYVLITAMIDPGTLVVADALESVRKEG